MQHSLSFVKSSAATRTMGMRFSALVDAGVTVHHFEELLATMEQIFLQAVREDPTLEAPPKDLGEPPRDPDEEAAE